MKPENNDHNPIVVDNSYPKAILGERISLDNLPFEENSEALDTLTPDISNEGDLKTMMNSGSSSATYNAVYKNENDTSVQEEIENKSQVSDNPVIGNS